MSDIKDVIEDAWENREGISLQTQGVVREAVNEAIQALDSGKYRISERRADGSWHIHTWLKKAILLSFRLNDSEIVSSAMHDEAAPLQWYDKVPLKFDGWTKENFQQANVRAVPGSFVRRGAYVAPGCVLMPSFVNLGAYIGENTMVDTWATVGSCAQIGKNVHLSGGVGIGGVLEPLQANPVIIEDNCFIGARAEVAEGVIVREGAVLSMGVYLGASTKIIDRSTGEIFQGEVPSYSVVVPGTLPGKTLPNGQPGPNLYCAVIVKRVDASTRAKTSLNDLLRD